MTQAPSPDNESTDTERPALHITLLRQLLIHQVAFVLIIGGMNVYNVIDGSPWWALWPSMIWGVVLTIHVCIVRSITVDEDWVHERAMELREHSYDFDHMRDLESRIVSSDFSVVPAAERQAHSQSPSKPESNADSKSESAGKPEKKVDEQ